jgi:hypothetical protein
LEQPTPKYRKKQVVEIAAQSTRDEDEPLFITDTADEKKFSCGFCGL